MRAMASDSLKLPHQPVETVHNPKPTSLTVRSVLRYVRYFMVAPHYCSAGQRVQPGPRMEGAIAARGARLACKAEAVGTVEHRPNDNPLEIIAHNLKWPVIGI